MKRMISDYEKLVEKICKDLESKNHYGAYCPECNGTKKRSGWCKEQKVWTLQECSFCGGSGFRKPIDDLLDAYYAMKADRDRLKEAGEHALSCKANWHHCRGILTAKGGESE
jgi:Zn ribbon nucleic-acid-binding protein